VIKLKTFSHQERPMAAMLKDILVQEGIECILRNDQLASAIGEIPFIECLPELWVIDDEVYPRARTLLNAWLKAPPEGPVWLCPQCHERCDAHFGACWSCGTLRD
jgi:hypothetical protein